MNKKEPNYQTFFPIGIIFLGTGVVFLAAVNPGIGVALMGVGLLFFFIAIKKKREEEEKK